LWRQDFDPGRSQFNRQGQPIEPDADLETAGALSVKVKSGWIAFARATNNATAGARRGLDVGPISPDQEPPGTHRELMLRPQTQRLAAGDQNQSRARSSSVASGAAATTCSKLSNTSRTVLICQMAATAARRQRREPPQAETLDKHVVKQVRCACGRQIDKECAG
jgi:hypothetical protein